MTARSLVPPLLGLALLFAATPATAHDGHDGTISHKHKEVRSRPEPTTSWHDAEVGELLYEQGRVSTLRGSTAAVLFRDDSTVSMRANTLLIVYGHHALSDRKKLIAMDAEVERGALRARLGELEGNPEPQRAEIGTPGAETELAGGNSLIKVDEEGTSRIHNHGEGEAKVKSKRGGKTELQKGMGVKVKKTKRASKPIPLPPTPGWVAGPEVFLGVSGKLSELRGAWTKVDEANTYFVEVATDAEGVDVLSAIEVPASVEGFEVHGLPEGRYHVRVASVDDDQFESIPSGPRAVELVNVDFAGPQGLLPEWDETDPLSPVPRVLPGTRLLLPPNIRCGLTAQTLDPAPLLLEGGRHELVCETDEGKTVAPFVVDVPELFPELLEQGGELDEAVEITRGQSSARELNFETASKLPRGLHIQAPEGVRVESLEPTGPGRWRVTLLADDSAAADAELRLSFLPPSADGPDATFATVPLSIHDSSEPEEPEPERSMIELGLGGGFVLFSPKHDLYQSTIATHQGYARPTGELVLRAGLYPIRWAGVELAGRVMPSRAVDSQVPATAYSIRAQAVGQLPYRITPFLVGGVELLGVRSKAEAFGQDLDFGGVLGGGVKFYATQSIVLRVGAAAMVHEGLGGQTVAHAEVDLGVSLVLGRLSAERASRR